MNDYQEFIRLSRYARWNGERRETWHETVARYFDFFPCDNDAIDAVLNHDVLPSMRALWAAGPALQRDTVMLYNCAFLNIDHPRAWDEILYLSMSTVGVGFSVERQHVNALPEVPHDLRQSDTTIVVRDSTIGWATALRELLASLYAGSIPRYDLSRVRPAGAILKIKGGTASGPQPLKDLFDFVISIFENARGRRLNSVECHDICCRVGECGIAGGVRRAALLSLSNLSDIRMREAKAGEWWRTAPWRSFANNSVAYTEKPDAQAFMAEWLSLAKSGSGERGIFSRTAAAKAAGRSGRRPLQDRTGRDIKWGCNPCCEIVLRPMQFCNLTNIIARADDDAASLERKARIAAQLGTRQAALTNFRYLRAKWRENCEDERLLGVGMAGIMDCPLLNKRDRETVELLEHLKEVVRVTNVEWSRELGINESTANTCVKPDGNSSQLVDCSSGIHPRFAQHYIRRVRQAEHDPLTRFMIDAGFPHEDDAMVAGHKVFAFPLKSPDGAMTRHDMSAVEHLEHWLMFQRHWSEHKPSITVQIDEDEWPEVGAWVWKHFDEMSGVSFLPKEKHTYTQAPYTEIDANEYAAAVAMMPKGVDWTELDENMDVTTGAKEYACSGGHCEI